MEGNFIARYIVEAFRNVTVFSHLHDRGQPRFAHPSGGARWYAFKDNLFDSGKVMRAQPGAMAPLIAIIGPDGSGKSTVCEHIVAWIGGYGSAVQVHLGKQSGNVARAVGRMPLLGTFMDRQIRRKVDGVNDRIKADIQPSLLPALVISAFTLRRRFRFKRMLALRKRGLIVVTDRFPQVVIPGAYDGPGFPDSRQGSWLVRRLARYERATFEWMASHRPDLVLRLNVDLDTACVRKPDHRREDLQRKIAVTPLLTYSGSPIVDIDANQSLARVVEEAETAVARTMAARGYIWKRTPAGHSAA